MLIKFEQLVFLDIVPSWLNAMEILIGCWVLCEWETNSSAMSLNEYPDLLMFSFFPLLSLGLTCHFYLKWIWHYHKVPFLAFPCEFQIQASFLSEWSNNWWQSRVLLVLHGILYSQVIILPTAEMLCHVSFSFSPHLRGCQNCSSVARTVIDTYCICAI